MSAHKLISEIYLTPGPHISFEFFPPKNEEGIEKLYANIEGLKQFQPDFCSVTWGAGGKAIRNSLATVSTIANKIGITTIAHFTGLGMTKLTVDEMLAAFVEQGIRNILVLRGDVPHEMDRDKALSGTFRYAGELVNYIRSKPECAPGKLGILVAGCPEGHPEAKSIDEDLDHLAHKVEEGAEGIVTQFFFDNRPFYRFMEQIKKRGVKVPVAVGVMLMTRANMIKKMVELSNCSVPKEVAEAIDRYRDDDASMEAWGIEYGTRQVKELWDHGHRHFHFYTLNRRGPTEKVLLNLKGELLSHIQNIQK